MKITRRMWGMAVGAVLALNLGLPAAQAAEEAPAAAEAPVAEEAPVADEAPVAQAPAADAPQA